MTKQQEGQMDDEPPNLWRERADRYPCRPFHPGGYERPSDKGGTGKYVNRGPVLFLNHLYRSGRVVYFPRSFGGGNGNLLHGGM